MGDLEVIQAEVEVDFGHCLRVLDRDRLLAGLGFTVWASWLGVQGSEIVPRVECSGASWLGVQGLGFRA